MYSPSYYFDHGSTTPLRQEVLDEMMPYFTLNFGNPSSLHQYGLKAKESLEIARATVARTINVNPREIIFTGSGTEANNLAILGTVRRLQRLKKGKHLITTGIEHASVLKTFKHLEKEGFEVTYLPVDPYGRVHLDEVKKSIRTDTLMVSIMHANNVIGTIQPISEIGRYLKEKNILFHTDAVQSYGKIPVNAQELHVDLLSINSHKIGGPKGVAALYMKKGIRIDPLYFGGEQERAIRPATQNVPGIVGFAKAAELAAKELEDEQKRLLKLRSHFISTLTKNIVGVKINGHPTQTLPNLINISVDNIEGQGLMLELDRLGLATSSGSACSSTDHEPSYVLLATNPSRQHALESLRITMGRTTTKDSVDKLIKGIIQSVNYWRKKN
ncbi:cysteine desulfurase [Microaerobacter geothermalis]|uniref:cysteine desulfurase family protein n=1 Tax=Microaerobacter geothermalis TaxID=674972 RepID=UPI001F2E7FAA|nr:cysteine desulfurase family protein [Microaerobacter geothermalis]MCF6093076.1 cysteine desulfurase [Microaerobacter geothermalis]